MPYKVFPEGNKTAVYQVDVEGKKVGKRRGLHDTPKAAQAQLAAMMANEKKPKKEVETLEEITTEGGEGLVTADEPQENKDYYSNPVEVVLVESSCGPLTFADLMAEQAAREATYEMYELTDQFSRLSRNIMNSGAEDKAAALMALANEYAELVSEKAKLEVEKELAELKQPSFLNKVKKLFGLTDPTESKDTPTSPNPDPQPDTTDTPGEDSDTKETTGTQDLFIWKEGDIYRWLAAYSNNRRDDDNPPEIISSESHKEFDEALEKGEWPMPEAWLWHVPYAVGVADYHAYDSTTGFPVAAGHFYKGMEWAAEGLIKAGWDGVSHGMPSAWIQRSKEDNSILVRHRTKEITFLPHRAAANKLAFSIISKETSMLDQEKGLPPHKREEFIKAFGEERVQQIEATLADKSKAADEAGIEQKETAPAETLPAGEIVKGLTFLAEQIKTLGESMDARLKSLEEIQQKEESFDLVTMLKSKSAIGKAETKIDGRSKEAKDGPEEAKAQSATQQQVGVPVGLLDGLFSLNQDWYAGGKG